MVVRVLGPLEVLGSDGVGVELTGDRQRRLLAFLACRAGRTVPADVLVDALWDVSRPAQPAAALHSTVARLRRRLDEAGLVDAIRTDATGYHLDVAVVGLDSTHFARLVESARLASPAEAVELLAEATSLWRGRAFDDFADVEELRLEGDRLDELRLLAEERLGVALVGAGRAAEAVGHLQRLTQLEPFREGPVAALMRALDAAGRQAAALRAYAGYRQRLGEELGLEPSGALQRLERSMVADPAGPHTWDAPRAFDDLRVSFVTSGRHRHLRLAVGDVGRGHTLVSVPAWVSSLDVLVSHGDPRSALLERLARDRRVVVYDQPGTGLSRGDVTDFSLDGAVADLAAVVDAIGQGPVTLLAMSAAGPTAVAFAAQFPSRVDRLVLVGTYADPAVAFPDRRLSRALTDVVRAHWSSGVRMIAQLFRPGVSDAGAERLGRVLRDSASPAMGAAYFAACFTTDAGPFVTQVPQPALVVHYRGDKVVPFAGGEDLAARLPNARFLPLEGGYHLPDVADTDRLERAVRSFLRGDAEPG